MCLMTQAVGPLRCLPFGGQSWCPLPREGGERGRECLTQGTVPLFCLTVLVASVYPRKPQAVERHVLPVLWYFLNSMMGNCVLPGHSGNVRTAVCRLCRSLPAAGLGCRPAKASPQNAPGALRHRIPMKQPRGHRRGKASDSRTTGSSGPFLLG